MTRGLPGIHDDESGQATVEFALVLPLALVCLALVIQTLVIVAAQITVLNDTRLAARAASMSPEPTVAATTTLRGDRQRTAIDVEVTELLVTVTLRREVRIMVPLVRRFMPSVDVRSSLTMALEPPIHTAVDHPQG